MATVDIYYKIENEVLSLRNDSANGYTLFSCPNDSEDDQPNFPWKSNTNITTIIIDNNIILPKSCYGLFMDMRNVESINNILNFNTSNVINMSYMFYNCRPLTSLDLLNFNTSEVIYMSNMFQGCRSLEDLDLSSFDTFKVTNMEHMFDGCLLLKDLDLLSFNTSNVTNMASMFEDCRSLTSLDLSNFNTPNVTSMDYMFSDCRSLTSLDLPVLDISKVRYMNYMFSECKLLTGVIRMNSNTLLSRSVIDMFERTTKEIYLAGTAKQLKTMAQTSSKGNVKVWFINIQPYVERDADIETKINVEAVINRSMFIDNDEIAIKVLKNGVDVSSSFIWNESPIIINENPKTVKAIANNIDADVSTTLTFSVTDSYGTSLEKTIIVPTAFYTMDFLAGGKEISFGEKAKSTDLYPELTAEPSDWSTNWTNYYEIVNGEYENISGISAPNFVVGTYYRKYDSLFKCAMDAEFKDFEGNLRSIYDLFYPVGSYYETSDTSFNPNDRWGGTWKLETEGQVHISGSTNGTYQINHANDNYGVGATDGGSEYIQEHSHKFTNPTVTSSGSHGHTVTIRYRTGAVARGTTESQAYANAANTSNNIAYTSGSDGAHTHSLTAGSVDEVKDVSTGQEGNMMPYIIVNRWHRVA